MNNYEAWGGFALCIIVLLFQSHLFVRPKELSDKHKAIMDEVAEKYISKEVFAIYQKDLDEIKNTTNKILDILIKREDK